jgi:antitoxin component of RelBE/YafQ-DinJ toxin-antitoxin module
MAGSAKAATAKAVVESTPEIRFRPAPEVYARAASIAESLGLNVNDVARMGLTQLANQSEIRLAPVQRAPALRDTPLHGVTVGRIAEIAAQAALAADASHVQAGRLASPDAAPARRTAAKPLRSVKR